MSEKEMNAYRFGTGQEPTDEMLEQIMKEVAQEARESSKKRLMPISSRCAVILLSSKQNGQNKLAR